ncbi:MAG: hypothetical protein LBC73_08260 [Oscillospiraceae bacterium]|jgi:hypothetical protein|nr:hypothetical protein [Oscillospiraceae bacterium]
MLMDELRKNREKNSLDTIGMTSDELNTYYRNGSDNVLRKIEEKRNSNVIMVADKSIQYSST